MNAPKPNRAERRKVEREKKTQIPDKGENTWFRKFDRSNYWLRFILLVLGIPAIFIFYKNCFKSSSKKFKEETQENGVLDPQPISSKEAPNVIRTYPFKVINPKILKLNEPPDIIGISLPLHVLYPVPELSFVFGTNRFNRVHFGDIFKGVDLNAQLLGCEIKRIHLGIKIISNRLFISTEFYDRESNKPVAAIEYNKWTLYRPNFIDFQQTDTSLEVTDIYKNIITRVKFTEPDDIIIQGYFVGRDSVLVLGRNEDCFSRSSQKDNMLDEIENIKSLNW